MKKNCYCIFVLILFFSYSLLRSAAPDSLLQLLPNASLQEKPKILNDISNLLLTSSPDSSIIYAEEAYRISEEIGNLKEKSISLLNLGNAARRSKKPTIAVNFFLQAKETAEKIEFYSVIDAALNNIGIIYSETGEYAEALRYYKESLELRKNSIKKPDLTASSYNNIGIIYRKLGAYEKAAEFYQKAADIFRNENNQRGLASVLTGLGALHQQMGKYTSSLEYLLQSQTIAQNIDDKLLQAKNLNNLGTVYHKIGNYDKALEFHHSSIEVKKEINDEKGIAASYLNIGNALSEKEEYIKALEYFNKALEIQQHLGSRGEIALIYNNIGNNYKKVKNHKEALKYFKMSLSIKENIHDLKGAANTKVNIGEVYLDMKMYNKAEEYIRSSLKTAEENQYREILNNGYSLLSKLFEMKSNFKEALRFYKYASAAQESLLNEVSVKKIAELRTLYETESKEREISLLKANQKILNIQNSKQKQQRNFALLFSLLFMALAFVLYNMYKIKKRVNIQLEAANKKLEKASRTDPLTGLSNRRDILIRLDSEVNRFNRNRQKFSLILADIDDFKIFNDKYGHDCGDYILKSIADVLEFTLRKQDSISRWGGEEFLILLPDTDLKGAVNAAEKIKKKVAQSLFIHSGKKLSITMTFGVSVFQEGMTIDTCVKEADIALYVGKERGKNRVAASSVKSE